MTHRCPRCHGHVLEDLDGVYCLACGWHNWESLARWLGTQRGDLRRKLGDRQIEEIRRRAAYATQQALAREFGVSQAQISRVLAESRAITRPAR